MAVDLRPYRGDATPAGPPAADTADTEPRSELGYRPALDGIRGLAVLAVLCFHNGFDWATGGFLGVSTFFTLSGFLITSLLIAERDATGTVRLREFWSRRFRRLMPASLLTLGGILVFGATVATADQIRSLRGDVFSALAYVANWRFIAVDRSYAELFSAPSPVQHFWSLAIEEQFYLAFPLLVVAVLAMSGGSRRVLGGVFAALVAASVAASLLLYQPGGDNLRIYYGTETRAAELLLGALLAVLMFRRFHVAAGPRRTALDVTGVVAVGATLWIWSSSTTSDAWLYRGGFALYALGSAAIIAAALQPGIVQRTLSIQALVWLGLISYGVYLVHWPVFLWLTEDRTGLTQWPLFGLRLAVTIPLAVASARLLEQPIRRRSLLTGRRGPIAVLVAVAVLVAGTVVVTHDPPARAVTLEVEGAQVTAAPVRVTLVGDQLARSLAPGLTEWDGGEVVLDDLTFPGCGFGRSTAAQFVSNWTTASPECDRRSEGWPSAIARFRPDVIVVLTGVGEVDDRRLARGDVPRAPGDAELDRWLTAELAAAADVLLESGAPVVWLTMPTLTPAGVPQTDPARVARFNELVRDVADERTGITVVDLGDRVDAVSPFGFEASDAPELVDWLAPQLADLAEAEREREAAAVAPRTDPRARVDIGSGPVVPVRALYPGERPRVLVAGDSFAYSVGFGLARWSASTGAMDASIEANFGCPIARGGRYRYLRTDSPIDEGICDWAVSFPQAVAASDPHAVLLLTGVWETADRLLPGDTTWRHLGDPVFDRYLERELLAAVDLLGASGARVVLATHPYVHVGRDRGMPDTLPESDPDRMDQLNAMLRRVAEQRPAFVTMIELQAWLRTQPGGELDPSMRGDGVHLSDTFGPILGGWLGPQLDSLIPRA